MQPKPGSRYHYFSRRKKIYNLKNLKKICRQQAANMAAFVATRPRPFPRSRDIFLMIFPLTEHAQQIAGWLPFISSDKGNNTRDNPKFITSSMFSLAIHSIPDDQHSPLPDNFVIYLFLFLIWFWFLLLLLILF